MVRYFKFMLLPVFLLAACNDDKNVLVTSGGIDDDPGEHFLATGNGDTVLTGIPLPALGKNIDPGRTARARRVPMTGQPEVVTAFDNVQPVGRPVIVPVSKPFYVSTPGEAGVKLPGRMPAKGNVVPAIQPQVLPALPLRMNDNANYDLQYLDVDQGLNSSYVSSILEDSRGNLWFGAKRGGVSRYDGHSFTHFSSREGLSDDIVLCMEEDQQGNLWFGTLRGGVSRYDGHNFTHFTTEEGLRHRSVQAILEDSRGLVWLGTDDGITCYDPEGNDGQGSFIHLTTENGLSYNSVQAILEDTRGYLWFGTRAGVSRYDPEANEGRGSFTRFSEADGLSRYWVWSIMEDNDGNIWFGTNGQGLISYDPEANDGEGTFSHFTTAEGLSFSSIQALLQDKRGNIWLGTNGGGVSRYEPKAGNGRGRFTHFTTAEGLSHNWVQAITEDSGGNIWFGTNGGGVVRFNEQSFVHFTTEEGLSHNSVWPIAEDSAGYLWFGTEDGVNRYDPEAGNGRGRFVRFTTKEGLGHDWISAILADSRGHLWFGTSKGVSRYIPAANGEVGSFTHFTTAEGLSDNFIRSITEDSRGNLWFGTNSGGATRYDPEANNGQGNFTQFTTAEGMSHDKVWSIMEDSRGNLWLGTERGLTLYHPGQNERADTFTHYTTNEGLRHNSVFSILEDSNGKIWIGTEGGVTRLDPKAGNDRYDFSHFTTEDGLSDNLVWSIQEDKQGRFWISTQKGISLLIPSGARSSAAGSPDAGAYKIFTFGVPDGLKRLDLQPNGVFLDTHNRMWWGTLEGLSVLDLDQFSLSDTPPGHLQLTHIEMRQQYVDYRRLSDGTHNRNAELQKDLQSAFDSVAAFYNYPTGMSLPYDVNHFTFHFSAIDWAAPHKIRYQYRMEGLDEDWSIPQTENKAEYRNMPYGTFNLQVRAIGGAHLWSEPFTYTFTIRPPWWLTGGAKVFYGLALLALLYYVRHLELRKQQRKLALEQEKLMQERKVNEQLRRVDKLKDQFLANTSHELRTPLQGIIGLSESLMDQIHTDPPEKQLEDLTMIVSSGKRLANLVNDILDFSKLKHYDIQLLRHPVNVRVLADIVLNHNAPLVKGRDLELINAVPGDLPAVDCDENRLQQVLYNLVGNAIKFTEKGYIKLDAREKNGMIEVEVEDTGIGIAEHKLEAIFQEFEQGDGSISREFTGTGLGLSISQQLVELHGGEMWVESEPEKGATFFFTLPISTEKATTLAFQPELSKGSEQMAPVSTISAMNSPALNQDDHIRILVVDDEPINQRVLRNHLSGQNFHLTKAMNGEEAIQAIEQNPDFDLVLLDVMMPRMSGYEVCRKLREIYLSSELPIIMITAKDQLQDIVQGLSIGANDYLPKPFHKEELMARINTQLDLHRIFAVAGKFIPSAFLHSLNRDRLTEVTLGDHIEQEVTVLFTDIRDYTTLAEAMKPEENFKFVNAFHGRLGPIIKQHRGFVNQYLGDAIMAIFPEDPGDALKAAVAMNKRLEEYNQERLAQGRAVIRIGIGMHTGSLIMGIIGDRERMDAATVADTVNTASRIEGLTKYYGASILLSGDSLEKFRENTTCSLRYLGKVQVKGKKEPVSLYECIDGDALEVTTRKLQTIQDFEKGVQQYYRREFSEATATFDSILAANPEDGPARLFRDKSSRYDAEGVPDDWTGVEVMTFK